MRSKYAYSFSYILVQWLLYTHAYADYATISRLPYPDVSW